MASGAPLLPVGRLGRIQDLPFCGSASSISSSGASVMPRPAFMGMCVHVWMKGRACMHPCGRRSPSHPFPWSRSDPSIIHKQATHRGGGRSTAWLLSGGVRELVPLRGSPLLAARCARVLYFSSGGPVGVGGCRNGLLMMMMRENVMKPAEPGGSELRNKTTCGDGDWVMSSVMRGLSIKGVQRGGACGPIESREICRPQTNAKFGLEEEETARRLRAGWWIDRSIELALERARPPWGPIKLSVYRSRPGIPQNQKRRQQTHTKKKRRGGFWLDDIGVDGSKEDS
jgi:hypothetical protein